MNRRFFCFRIIAFIFSPLLFFCLTLASSAYAVPPTPNHYSGDAFLSVDDSQPVSLGIEITAWADGILYGATNTSPNNHYSFLVIGDDPSTPTKDGCDNYEQIIFYVDEYVAVETGIFVSGETTLVDLHVNADKQPVWLKVNEVRPVGDPEWIELYNPSNEMVYLDDYYLLDSVLKFWLSGYSIGPQDYLVIELIGVPPDFVLGDDGDRFVLGWVDRDGFTADGYPLVIDVVEYGAISSDEDTMMKNAEWVDDPNSSLARLPDHTDTDDCSSDFAIDATPTPGSSNDILPVGGIYIPVNKLELIAPYIGLTILLAVAVIAVVYVKKRKRDAGITS